jgi:hypothetical protein
VVKFIEMGGDIVLINILLSAVIIIGVFASIAAWLNTQIIMKDLAAIKEKLGIKEEKKPSMFDDDLDKN